MNQLHSSVVAAAPKRQPRTPPRRATPWTALRNAGNRALRAALAGGGQPLSSRVRTEMEARLGGDFSAVRVRESAAVAALGAQALTTGGAQIHFAPGRYRPHSAEGRRLLTHELAHVEQQRRGRVPASGAARLVDDRALEAEADGIARGDTRPATPAQHSAAPTSAVQPYWDVSSPSATANRRQWIPDNDGDASAGWYARPAIRGTVWTRESDGALFDENLRGLWRRVAPTLLSPSTGGSSAPPGLLSSSQSASPSLSQSMSSLQSLPPPPSQPLPVSKPFSFSFSSPSSVSPFGAPAAAAASTPFPSFSLSKPAPPKPKIPAFSFQSLLPNPSSSSSPAPSSAKKPAKPPMFLPESGSLLTPGERQGYPLGFRSAVDFARFAAALHAVFGALDGAATICITGSSIMGESYLPKDNGKPRPFGAHSDYDVSIISATIYDLVKGRGASLRKTPQGAETGVTDPIHARDYGLFNLSAGDTRAITEHASLPVNIMVFRSLDSFDRRSNAMFAISSDGKLKRI